ncbi:hypothetical protein ACIRBY_00180 [Streptomyces sp. NPDC096136]|uniref:hypothetical protein n=1 Tax=Streptomyces sp. NPDC096136 TaxID=3366076 RepID=UPI0037F22FD6
MYENAQERPRTPTGQVAGITDGVVELRKRRPSVADPDDDRPAPSAAGGGGRGTAAEPPAAPGA